MFVVGIDRPWTETPFMMQGFLLENADQLWALQKYCRSVTIDRSRSIGDQYSAKVFDKDAALRGADGLVRKHPDVVESRIEAQRFIKVARSFKGKIHTRRQPHIPRIRSERPAFDLNHPEAAVPVGVGPAKDAPDAPVVDAALIAAISRSASRNRVTSDSTRPASSSGRALRASASWETMSDSFVRCW